MKVRVIDKGAPTTAALAVVGGVLLKAMARLDDERLGTMEPATQDAPTNTSRTAMGRTANSHRGRHDP